MDNTVDANAQKDSSLLDDNQFITSEWMQLITLTSPQTFNLLAKLSAQKSSDFADEFYSYMLKDKEASLFLSSQQVHDRLHGSMTRWIADILTNRGEHLAAVISYQQKIGQVHARIGIPVDLVERGVRRLKWALYDEIAQVEEDKAYCLDAMRFASISMDLALEVMSKSYSQSHNIEAKNEESYRLFSVLENASMERERQNASLLNWENAFIFSVATGSPLASIQDLSDSEFSLWFNHKGKSSFSDTQRVRTISETIKETDEYIRSFSLTSSGMPQDNATLLKTVRSKIYRINILLGSLFDEIQKIESGKDALTLLLNRRFLPTILRHEISLAMHSTTALGVVMIDIDDFKIVNDTYGHAAGDTILKKIAEMLDDSVRNSDYIFRHGGEEFLIVLTETSKSAAHLVIERLRKKIQQQPIELQKGAFINVTISAGIAMYNGHPDYECLIKAADEALYQAKTKGKNRIEFAVQE